RFRDLQNDFEISIPIWRSPKRFRDFHSDLEISKTISRFLFRFGNLQNDFEISISISRSPKRFGDLHRDFEISRTIWRSASSISRSPRAFSDYVGRSRGPNLEGIKDLPCMACGWLGFRLRTMRSTTSMTFLRMLGRHMPVNGEINKQL